MGTVAIDTNVLVRFLMLKDPKQTKKVRALFESSIVFLSETVFLESEWVLRTVYDLDREQISLGYRSVLRLRNVQVDRRNSLLGVISAYEKGFDFADALHYVAARGVEMKTFDRKFVNRAKKEGWKVSLP